MRKDFSRSSYVASCSQLRVISPGLTCDLRKVSDIQGTTGFSKLRKGTPLYRSACQYGRWESIRIRKGRPRVIIRSELRIRSKWTHRKRLSSLLLHDIGQERRIGQRTSARLEYGAMYGFVMRTIWKYGLSLLLQSMHGFLVCLAKILATSRLSTPSGRTGGRRHNHHFRQTSSLPAGTKQSSALLTIFKGHLAS